MLYSTAPYVPAFVYGCLSHPSSLHMVLCAARMLRCCRYIQTCCSFLAVENPYVLLPTKPFFCCLLKPYCLLFGKDTVYACYCAPWCCTSQHACTPPHMSTHITYHTQACRAAGIAHSGIDPITGVRGDVVQVAFGRPDWTRVLQEAAQNDQGRGRWVLEILVCLVTCCVACVVCVLMYLCCCIVSHRCTTRANLPAVVPAHRVGVLYCGTELAGRDVRAACAECASIGPHAFAMHWERFG